MSIDQLGAKILITLDGRVPCFYGLSRLTRKLSRSLLLSCLSATGRSNKWRQHDRIPGLDGQLCTGQPAYPDLSSKLNTRSAETGLLQARLVVASFGAVIVGLLVAATTPDKHGEPAGPPNEPIPVGQSTPSPPVVSKAARNVKESILSPVKGFAVMSASPMAERFMLPGATIGEIVSITRPLADRLEQPKATTELFEVTLPARKPSIKAQFRRLPVKQTHQPTFWKRLPWLVAR